MQFSESTADGVTHNHVEVLYAIDKNIGGDFLRALGLENGAKRYINADKLDNTKYFYQSDVLIDALAASLTANATTVKNALEGYISANGGTAMPLTNEYLKLNLTAIRKLLNKGTSKNKESIGEIAENSLSPDELFLTNGFKAIVSKLLVATITDWFANKFMIIYQANAVQLTRRFVNPKENTIYIEKTLNEAAEAFGISSNALGFKSSKSGEDAVLYSLFEQGDKGMAIPADVFESYGTIRFINEFPLVIRALLTGAVLVVDEFDASIHPMALMNIINIFHNDDINKKRAQLIFNTHNPIFLNSNLYRRDEIKFVERDDVTHASTHYALSDFKTAGASGVRKGEDYMKNYFVSQYGAIKDVDFSPFLKDVISQLSDNE